MAEPAVAAAAERAPAAAQPPANADAAAPQSLWDRLFPVLRMVLLWYLIQTVTSGGGAGPLTRIKEALNPPTADPIGDSIVSSPTAHDTHALGDISGSSSAVQSSSKQPKKPLQTFRNAFAVGDTLSVRVYISPDATYAFDAARDQSALRWHLDNIPYDPQGNVAPDAVDGMWTTHINVTVDQHLLANGSLFAHVFVTKDGVSHNPQDAAFDQMQSLSRSMELTTFRPRDLITKKRNLLEAATQSDAEEAVDSLEPLDDSFVAYWKPQLTINVVHDATIYSTAVKPPPFVASDMQFDSAAQLYAPVLYLNDFWVLEEHLVPINKSIAALPLALSFYPLHLYKFALYTQMAQNFANQEATGASTKRDTDKMKAMFIETNPILLGITVFVSLLHSLFDFLAFKNDVKFWQNQKSLAGLSLRTIGLNTFFQLVIFLYLLDNDTSWMILMSSFISLVIECWKIKKAVRVTRDATTNKLVFAGEATYEESPTAEHDRIAVAHLSFVLYPLIAGHAIYTLTYGVHKGWYSWLVSSLTSFVYAFGFIMMTPQLYINYKLKSVAHLPWRAMVYKSLNTFIDDLFAFVIKMPWMHRLSCFRDDLIFFVYLYQRYKYPVDATRTNEFGQSGSAEVVQEPVGQVVEAIEAETVEEETEEMMAAASESTEYLQTKRSQTLATPIHNVD